MKSSVSAPVWSRKYSAMVSAESATRRRAPGGSFIWPKTITVWSMTDLPVSPILASCISSQRSLPSRVRSPTPAKHGVAAVEAGDAGDQLLDDDGLADAGAAEQAGLAAADERAEQVDDLDAGLEDLGLGREVGELGRRAGGWSAGSLTSTGPRSSIGSPTRLKTRPSVSADRHGHRRAGVDDLLAAPQAVGRAERDGAHPAAAEVLGDLAPQGLSVGLARARVRSTSTSRAL